jgi:hypothetical protein
VQIKFKLKENTPIPKPIDEHCVICKKFIVLSEDCKYVVVNGENKSMVHTKCL